jgi:hypothetical protein
MRNLTFILILSILFFSCKKDLNSLSSDANLQIDKTAAYLKGQMSSTDFKTLDFTKADVTSLDSGNILLWRVPFTGKSIATDFVLVQARADGTCTTGRVIHLDNNTGNGYAYNGAVTVQTLARQSVYQSDILNGYIAALHPSGTGRVTVNSTVSIDVVPASAGAAVLPELVIVGYVNSTGTPPTQATYMMLMTLLATSPNGSGAGSNSGSLPVGSGGSAPGTTTGTVTGTGIYTPLAPNGGTGTLSPSLLTKPISVSTDYTANLPIIDLSSFLKCFDNIPSTGATFTIKLCSDLPVSSNPAFITLGTNSGHTFITLTKTNGSQSITQSFGFYPVQNPSVLNPFGTIPGGIKNNGGHEVNASIQMTITANQFSTVATNSLAWANNTYSLSTYNCTNYALNLFNSVRTTPISIDPLTVYLPSNGTTYNPAAPPATATIIDSPQSLFIKLQGMKTSGSSEAQNIAIDQSGNTFSPVSHGACN